MSLCEPPWLLHAEHRTSPLWVLPASLLYLPPGLFRSSSCLRVFALAVASTQNTQPSSAPGIPPAHAQVTSP